MKKYTIDVNEFAPKPNLKNKQEYKLSRFSFSALLLAIVVGVIISPDLVDISEIQNYVKDKYESTK